MSTNKEIKPKQVTWFNGCGGRIGIVVGKTGDYAFIGAALRHSEDEDMALNFRLMRRFYCRHQKNIQKKMVKVLGC